jgi:sirohydrochlorin ferrochelatase
LSLESPFFFAIVQSLVRVGCWLAGHRLYRRLALAAILFSAAGGLALAGENASKKNVKDSKNGFLVIAPDRGFAGNEEIADAFDVFTKGRNASLVFVTDERSGKYIKSGLDTLVAAGARRIAAIPLFISAANPRFQLARTLLDREKPSVPVSYGRPYGETFFAVEDLADKFRAIKNPANSRVVVVGYGATDNDNEQAMRADLRRIAESAAAGFGLASIEVVIAYGLKDEEGEKKKAVFKRELAEALNKTGDAPDTVVVPFHFGPRFDSMMSFDAQLRRQLPRGVQFIQKNGSDDSAVRNLAIWLAHAANRSQQLASQDFGIIVLSHGSDFIWNESVRNAVEPLTKDYKIEFAFSMADQPMIERAIHRLEQRGAKAAIIVRLFALSDSFRRPVERMAGADIEGVGAGGAGGHGHAPNDGGHSQRGHGAHGGHGHDPSAIPTARIRSTLPVETVGGLDSSPLFAEALLDRAQALSRNRTRDTVILVAHGSGDDRLNQQWEAQLEAIAEHMRTGGGSEFLAIRTATWREDWADKRGPQIEKIRTMVEDAARQGGRALVIPARTVGEGPERKFLSGLEYDLGSGFAPHPKFVQWMEEQIKRGVRQFNNTRYRETASAEPEEDAWAPEWAF